MDVGRKITLQRDAAVHCVPVELIVHYTGLQIAECIMAEWSGLQSALWWMSGCWQERRGGTASGLSCCQLNTALIDDEGDPDGGHDEDGDNEVCGDGDDHGECDDQDDQEEGDT